MKTWVGTVIRITDSLFLVCHFINQKSDYRIIKDNLRAIDINILGKSTACIRTVACNCKAV